MPRTEKKMASKPKSCKIRAFHIPPSKAPSVVKIPVTHHEVGGERWSAADHTAVFRHPFAVDKLPKLRGTSTAADITIFDSAGLAHSFVVYSSTARMYYPGNNNLVSRCRRLWRGELLLFRRAQRSKRVVNFRQDRDGPLVWKVAAEFLATSESRD
ncbi:hypothetical protein PENSPDRAFT_684265 [Peniophora sp. CONT]|nr:hypothetical protein PENSPDRAFT_684265 [Peniophora sp. CONT]